MTAKAKRGRPPKSAVLSGIKPEQDQWSDICNRITYGTSEWRIVRLRNLIRQRKLNEVKELKAMLLAEQQAAKNKQLNADAGKQADAVLAALERGDENAWQLADNYLSACVALREVELTSLWKTFSAQFERAVLSGDADWFTRQAKAIDKGGLPHRAQFNAKVVNLLEHAMWRTRSALRDRFNEAATLTPAGKFTDATANDIYAALKKRDLQDGRILVEGWNAESKDRVMAAIHELAKQLRFELRKTRQRKATKPRKLI